MTTGSIAQSGAIKFIEENPTLVAGGVAILGSLFAGDGLVGKLLQYSGLAALGYGAWKYLSGSVPVIGSAAKGISNLFNAPKTIADSIHDVKVQEQHIEDIYKPNNAICNHARAAIMWATQNEKYARDLMTVCGVPADTRPMPTDHRTGRLEGLPSLKTVEEALAGPNSQQVAGRLIGYFREMKQQTEPDPTVRARFPNSVYDPEFRRRTLDAAEKELPYHIANLKQAQVDAQRKAAPQPAGP